MKARITFVRRGARGVVRTGHDVDAESLRFGRSTDCEVFLEDGRVTSHQAVLHSRGKGLFLEAAGGADLRHNGKVVLAAAVRRGDRIGIGPYEAVLVPPPPGADVALEIELVRLPGSGSDLADLLSRSPMSIESTRLSKRALSWTLFGLVLVPFLVVPIVTALRSARAAPAHAAAPLLRALWSPGNLSSVHRFLADDCVACHARPFRAAGGAACTGCHKGLAAHAATGRPQGPACTDCHKEHRGERTPVIAEDVLCVRCHARLARGAPGSTIRDVSDFDESHPEFRLPTRRDRGLVFAHDWHLSQASLEGPGGPRPLACTDCHAPEAGGGAFRPTRFDQHCRACHILGIESAPPTRTLPHGDPDAVRTALREFYAAMALEGGSTPAGAERKLRGREWAAQRAAEAEKRVFGAGGCGTCHVVKESGDVVPVRPSSHFGPGTRFSHARHRVTPCARCHAAGSSSLASDVLLPKIGTCRECHGAARARTKVPSPCTLCHVYHDRRATTEATR